MKGAHQKKFLRFKNIYGNQVFDISTVRYWARESKRNWIQLTNRERPGHPELRNSTEIRQKIDEKICKNCQITQRALSGSLGIGLGTMNKFAHGLEYKRLCAKWVSKFLTREMKAQRKVIYFAPNVTYTIYSFGHSEHGN